MKKLLIIIFILSYSFTTLLSSIFLVVANTQIYKNKIDDYNITATYYVINDSKKTSNSEPEIVTTYFSTSTLSNEDLFNIYENVILYLFDQRTTLDTKDPRGDYQNFFNEKEISHMQDVKSIFRVLQITLGFALTLIAVLMFINRKYKFIISENIAKISLISLCFPLLLATLSFLVSLFDFSNAFLMFHEISFSNDNWLLDPRTDNLIKMLPEKYFQDMLTNIIYVYICIGISPQLFLLLFVKFRKEKKG